MHHAHHVQPMYHATNCQQAGMVMAMGPDAPPGFMPPTAFMGPMPGMMMAGPMGLTPPMMAMPPPHMMSQASMISSTSLPPGEVGAGMGGVMPPEATAGMAPHDLGSMGYTNGHMPGTREWCAAGVVVCKRGVQELHMVCQNISTMACHPPQEWHPRMRCRVAWLPMGMVHRHP